MLEKDANFNPAIGHLMNTSPPLIVGNIAIVPTSLENGRVPKSMKFPKGDIMAFDVRTGRKLWTFHTIPRRGEFGADTWLNNSNEFSGNTGAWTPFTVDEELGYVYIPVEAATGDQYGGPRPGNNLFSSSLVCLEVKTGQTDLALPAHSPRHLGLRPADGSDPGRHHGRRPPHQGRRPVDEDRVRLCLRSDQRQAGVADRGAAGAAERRPGREDVADAAVSHETAGLRSSGFHVVTM